MDNDLYEQFQKQQEQLDHIEKSVNQMKMYFLWTLIITGVVVVLPVVGLLFLLPQVFSAYEDLGI